MKAWLAGVERSLRLSAHEVKIATYIGKVRNRLSMATKTNIRRDPLQDDERMHIEAVGAELAIAKFLNIYPDLSPTGGELPQFDMVWQGYKLDVKRRDRTDLDLLIPKLNTAVIYVLVYGSLPNYEPIGWLDGSLVKITGAWTTFLPYGSCWMVKRKDLRQFSRTNEGTMVLQK